MKTYLEIISVFTCLRIRVQWPRLASRKLRHPDHGSWHPCPGQPEPILEKWTWKSKLGSMTARIILKAQLGQWLGIFSQTYFRPIEQRTTHRRGKDHCTAALQFNKIGFDKKWKNECSEEVETIGTWKLDTSHTVILPSNGECSLNRQMMWPLPRPSQYKFKDLEMCPSAKYIGCL